jgi:PAS domain S-box-containing protein
MAGHTDILRVAVELAHLGTAELDTDGRFQSVNVEYASMLGQRTSDLIGQHWTVSVHPDDQTRVKEAYELARTKGRGYVEIRGLRGDSTFLYQALTVTGITDFSGAFKGYHCLRHDISGYKRQQETLMLAVESVANGLLMCNVEGEIHYVNRAVEELFGYSRNELIGLKVETLVPQRLQSRHLQQREAFNESRSGKPMAGRDLLGLRKDGVELPLQVHLNRLETDTGEMIICTIIDIAERLRHQQQLELAKQAAEAANRAKSDFLARMSHEIRTPMNLIMGMNALLLESPLDEKQRQHVEISHRNVRRLLRLINGILDLSKVEAGKLVLSAVAFDLKHVLKECAATIGTAIEQKGLGFEIAMDPDVGQFWFGDSERLQQVLLNLIGNSAKFTESGKITVEVRPENGEEGRKGLRFIVTDTGCGIPPDKSTMIFEAFQQVEGAMNRPYEGTGLGLSIAKTLVEMMSGSIWVEPMTEPGARIAFTVFFPEATEYAAKERKAARAAKKNQAIAAGTRILLVEDNPENVILMEAYLDGTSLSIELASNGIEAVEHRKRNPYDLILMDIQMPVMDGYTATREIRAWERLNNVPGVPIVALTAHALTGASGESLEAGCDGHLTKPVERNDLLAAIAKYAQPAAKPVEPIPEAILARRPAFLANRREDVAKMRDALAGRDFATIQAIGHNCKGTGTGFGFPDISTLGAAIEKSARAMNASELVESIREFENCVQANSGSPPRMDTVGVR